ncbi:MAG: hypothetical protein HUJ26_24030 [Planctomycetaceae bacterium]|nr:hypothetical protein [Planctomycetaceae bacterium]
MMKIRYLQHESCRQRLLNSLFAVVICSHVGCGTDNKPAPPPSPPDTQSSASVELSQEPQIDLTNLKSDDPTHEVPEEPRHVGTIRRPVSPEPSQSQDTLNRHGYHRYTSKHLVLFTDIEPEIAQRLVAMVDQEYEAWIKGFGPLPEAADQSEFRMIGYLMRDMGALVELGLVPRLYLNMRTGGHIGDRFWMLDQATDYYRRHLLFHEATHCFMTIMPDTSLPKWYLEGMAEMVATHRLQEDGTIVFGVLPENREDYDGWGRIKTIQEEVAAGRFKSIAQLRSIERIDPVDEVRDYAWSWALCYFLEKHPRYQERFHSLQTHWRSGAFVDEFDRLFMEDMEKLNTEWLLFVTSLMEGYDLQRAAMVWNPESDGGNAIVQADRGWQSTGWTITEGETYRIIADGEVTLANEPKPWVSQPNGITLEYFSGQPIGRLFGIVVDPAFDRTPQVIEFGRESSWTATTSGTLFLRVNDAWNSLYNNSGSYRVTREQK